MKNIFFLVVLCLIHNLAFAESLTWMSKNEAEKLAVTLKNEKYLFYYCDCCDQAQATLVKITAFAVENSGAGEDLFGVKITGTKVMRFESDLNGNFSKAAVLNEKFDDWASLNNSMLPKDGRGLPLGYFLGFDAQKVGSCMDFIYYPNTDDTDLFSSVGTSSAYQEYYQWYKNHILSSLSYDYFIGKYDLIDICPNASNCKGYPPGMAQAKIVFDTGGNTSLLMDKQNSKGTWTLERGKLIVKEKGVVAYVYGFRRDGSLLILRNMKYANPEDDFRIYKLKKL